MPINMPSVDENDCHDNDCHEDDLESLCSSYGSIPINEIFDSDDDDDDQIVANEQHNKAPAEVNQHITESEWQGQC